MSEKRQLSDFEKAFASARKKSGGGEGLFEWKSPKTGKVGLYSTRYKEEGLPSPKEIKAMKAKGKVIGLQESPTAGPATNAPPVVPNDVAATPATPQAAQVAERVSAPVSNDDGGSLFGPLGLTALFGGAAAALGLKALGRSADRQAARAITNARARRAGTAAVRGLRETALASGIQVGAGHIPLQLGPGRGRSSMPATPDVIVTPPPHVPKQLESGPLPAQVGTSGKPLAQAKPKAPKAPKAPRKSRTKGASTGALSATATPSASAVETAIKANTTGSAGTATGQVTGGEAPTTEQIVQEIKTPKPPKTITRKRSAGTAGVTPSAAAPALPGPPAPPATPGVPQAKWINEKGVPQYSLPSAPQTRTNAGAAASPKVEDLSAQPGSAIGSSSNAPEPVTVRRTASTNPIGPTPAATPEQQVAQRIVTEGVTAAAPAPNNPAPGSMEDALRNLRNALGTSNSPVESIIAKAAPVAEAADVIPANETESQMYDRIARESVAPSGKAELRGIGNGPNPLGNMAVDPNARFHGSVKSIGTPETELFDLGARVGNGPVTYREKMKIHALASKVPFKPLSEISGNLRANQQGTVSDVIREHVGQSRGEGAVVDLVRSDLGALTDPDLKRGLKQRALKDFARALDTGRVSIDALPPEVQVAHYRLKNLELKAERQPDSIKADALFEGDDMVKARTTLADALVAHDVPLAPVDDPIERARPRRDTGDVPKHLFGPDILEKSADEILANSGSRSMVDKKEKKKWGARRAQAIKAGKAATRRAPAEAAKVAEVLDKGAETIEPGSLEHLAAKLAKARDELVKSAKGSKGKGKGKIVGSIVGGLMAAGLADRLNRN